MQTENNFFAELKNHYRHGGMTIRLIFINVAVFLFIGLLDVFSRLIGPSFSSIAQFIGSQFFTLQTDLYGFITHPWGLFTSIFAHFGLWHLLFNMLFLYFSGRMFEQVFDQRRLLYTYIVGGVFGGLFEIISHFIFPGMSGMSGLVVGASGSIMAILVALAFYQPRLEVSLFGLFKVRLVFLALFFIVKDLFSLGLNDGIAHFAHLGGAILGLWSIQNIYANSNIITASERLGNRIVNFFSVAFGKSSKAPKMKVTKGGGRTQTFKTDEEYNAEMKQRQEYTDAILDKISKSGYESLTKKEKDFLFNQSKGGKR